MFRAHTTYELTYEFLGFKENLARPEGFEPPTHRSVVCNAQIQGLTNLIYMTWSLPNIATIAAIDRFIVVNAKDVHQIQEHDFGQSLALRRT
jgi:hypothetical protein